jgi:hypothetical protein
MMMMMMMMTRILNINNNLLEIPKIKTDLIANL